MYCKEYNEWTNSNEAVSFSIASLSHELRPTQTNDEFGCEGIGCVGFYKDEDGLLLLKMKSTDDIGYELVSYRDVSKILNVNHPK